MAKISLKKKLIRVFNAWIRKRDDKHGCISCLTGKCEQAGHYWSTSQCPQPSMRFNEKNVNGQCIRCNCFLEGNRQGYREGLIHRYGPEILDTLDIVRSMPQHPWTDFEYKMMIKKYS